jgi:cytochrome c biogenesis protein CcmG, thiol:disulfide interchange protein DsbE
LPSTPSFAPPDAPARPPRARLVLAGIALLVVAVVGVVTLLAVRDGDDEPTLATGTTTPVPVPGAVRIGDTAPDFALATLDGGTVRLSELRGTPVVLNLWASYCNPCREEFPLLRDADRSADGDYVVLGVDTEDIRGDAVDFAEEQRATWVNAFDPDGVVKETYGARGLPYTYFIDADGTVQGLVISELGADDLATQLAKITGPR